MEMHGTEEFNLAVQSSIPAVETEDEDGQYGAMLRMIYIAKSWRIECGHNLHYIIKHH
jgi:hypothetical protein